jgi:hypothetical protein
MQTAMEASRCIGSGHGGSQVRCTPEIPPTASGCFRIRFFARSIMLAKKIMPMILATTRIFPPPNAARYLNSTAAPVDGRWGIQARVIFSSAAL